jgi:ferritin-like metal-binding protein YciE
MDAPNALCVLKECMCINSTSQLKEMNMSIREELIDWLRDAYAMERGLEVSLKKQAENDELGIELRQRAEMHLEETRRHAETVESLLKGLDADTSAIKTGTGKLAETVKGFGTKFARDEQIKDLLTAYAMEHFEIACYTALIAAAEAGNFPEVIAACRTIIEDEQEMADWLQQALPRVVTGYLAEHTHATA